MDGIARYLASRIAHEGLNIITSEFLCRRLVSLNLHNLETRLVLSMSIGSSTE